MENKRMMRWSTLALRIALGAVFVFAGTLKALDPSAFVKAIENYQMLPRTLAVVLAFYLPYLEIFCGTALLLRRLQAGALAILGGLMFIFIAALLAAWARGLDIDCGCFGAGDGKARYGLALMRDLALLAGIGFLAWRSNDHK